MFSDENLYQQIASTSSIDISDYQSDDIISLIHSRDSFHGLDPSINNSSNDEIDEYISAMSTVNPVA